MQQQSALDIYPHAVETPFASNAATIGGIHAGAFALNEPQPVFFVPINPLEAAILDAATAPETLPQFYLDFASTEFLVVTGVAPEGVVGSPREVTPGRDGLNLRSLQIGEHAILPVFSSAVRFHPLFTSRVDFVRLKGAVIADLAKDMHLLLNPGRSYSKLFVREEVNATLDRSIFTAGAARTMPTDAPQAIVPAPDSCQRMMQTLTCFLSRFQVVRSATLATFGEGTDLSLAITFDSSTPPAAPGQTSVADRIMGCAALVAHPFLADTGSSLFFFRESDTASADQAECQVALAAIPPFFSRQ